MEALALCKLSLDDKEGAQQQASTSSGGKTKSKRSGAARRKLKKERLASSLTLPPEIVSLILDMAYPKPLMEDLVKEVKPNGQTRAGFLARASLVCRAWAEEAQALLWRVVILKDDKSAASFVLGAEKGRVTEEIGLWAQGYTTISGGVASGVLQGLRGTRAVHVARVGTPQSPLPYSVFAHSALAGEF